MTIDDFDVNDGVGEGSRVETATMLYDVTRHVVDPATGHIRAGHRVQQ